MAGRLKAGGVQRPAKKPRKSKGGAGSGGGKNTISAAEATEEFEEIFRLHAKLGEVSGRIRKEISDAYATAAGRLEVPKKIVKHQFALEKHRRETAKKEAEFDGRDRDALMKMAQVFGEESPFGQFALRAAGNAKRDEFGGSASSENDDDPDVEE